jgi:hypothetical protein
MVLNVEETPIFNSVTILGRLSFEEGMNVHLQANHIWVKNGQFFIGSEETPFEMNA